MNARTLTVFRLYQTFNGIIFTGPIWAVFLLSRGLSLSQFGIVEAALHVGMLIAQVPMGALADALGRRRLLIAAGFFTATAELGYVYAPGFLLICAAGAVHGVAFALRTGADEAYLFDALAHDDAQAQFPRMLGGLWAVFQFASAISFLAGGLIATYSRPPAFWLTAGWAAVTSWWFYAAPLFQSRGASDALLGLVLGGGMLAGSGFSWVGGRIGERVPLSFSVGAASVAAAAGLVTGSLVPGLAAPVIILVAIAGAPELVYVTLSTYLQQDRK